MSRNCKFHTTPTAITVIIVFFYQLEAPILYFNTFIKFLYI